MDFDTVRLALNAIQNSIIRIEVSADGFPEHYRHRMEAQTLVLKRAMYEIQSTVNEAKKLGGCTKGDMK